MKKFLILIISLLLTGPCFAFNCGDDFGNFNDQWKKYYVDNEYTEFVQCRAFNKISKQKFGESVDEDLFTMLKEMEIKKALYSQQEYDSNVDYILQLKIMNYFGDIPNGFKDSYSIMLSMDGLDKEEIEEEYSGLLADTRLVKDKQRYKVFIVEAVTYLMNKYGTEYRIVDLTANSIKLLNTSNKSGMKGQLTDVYNNVIKYNKGKSYARYK